MLDDHLQEGWQAVFHAKVGTIPNCVLRHQHDLLGASGDKVDDLLNDVEWPLADLPPFNARDRAECAVVVAAVGDLDVGRGTGVGAPERRKHPLAPGDFGGGFSAEQFVDDIPNLVPLASGKDVIDAVREIVTVVA